jgi:hypothetical protein
MPTSHMWLVASVLDTAVLNDESLVTLRMCLRQKKLFNSLSVYPPFFHASYFLHVCEQLGWFVNT